MIRGELVMPMSTLFSIVPRKEKRGDVWRYRYEVDLSPGENTVFDAPSIFTI